MGEVQASELADLEHKDAKEVIKHLNDHFAQLSGDELSHSLSTYLSVQIKHPLKVFAATYWIHSKGLQLSSLCREPTLLNEINASNERLAKSKKVSNRDRKLHHLGRIESILQRPLQQVFRQWTVSRSNPLTLSVGTLSDIECALCLASHLSPEELCRRLNEAVNGVAHPQEPGTQEGYMLGQKPLSKHFRTLCEYLRAEAPSRSLRAASEVNPRLRSKLAREASPVWNSQSPPNKRRRTLPDTPSEPRTPGSSDARRSSGILPSPEYGRHACTPLSDRDNLSFGGDGPVSPNTSGSLNTPGSQDHDRRSHTPLINDDDLLFGGDEPVLPDGAGSSNIPGLSEYSRRSRTPLSDWDGSPFSSDGPVSPDGAGSSNTPCPPEYSRRSRKPLSDRDGFSSYKDHFYPDSHTDSLSNAGASDLVPCPPQLQPQANDPNQSFNLLKPSSSLVTPPFTRSSSTHPHNPVSLMAEVYDKVKGQRLPVPPPNNTTDRVPLLDNLSAAKCSIQGFVDEVAQDLLTAHPQINEAWKIYQWKAAAYEAARKELTVSTESFSCSNLPKQPPAVDELTQAEHPGNGDVDPFLALLQKASDATVEMANAREEYLRVKGDEEIRLQRRDRALQMLEELKTW